MALISLWGCDTPFNGYSVNTVGHVVAIDTTVRESDFILHIDSGLNNSLKYEKIDKNEIDKRSGLYDSLDLIAHIDNARIIHDREDTCMYYLICVESMKPMIKIVLDHCSGETVSGRDIIDEPTRVRLASVLRDILLIK